MKKRMMLVIKTLWETDNMRPKYYSSMKITPIEYIMVNDLDFCSGNIIKYASRWDKKGDAIGDLKKIIEYANLLLQRQFLEEEEEKIRREE